MNFQYPVELATLLGVLAPIIIQFLVNNVPNATARFFISLGLSAFTGAVAVYLAGMFDAGNIIATISIIFVASEIAFKTWWKPLFNKMGYRKSVK